MATTLRTYGPDVPDSVVLQQNDWSCAVRSTFAALWSMAQLGQTEPVTYGDGGPRDVYDWLVPTYDDQSVGLHAANGAGLVEALTNHGYRAAAVYPVDLGTVQELAGTVPMMLGGSGWNHWVYCRGAESDGTLVLANPSPGHKGIGNELLTSFDALGPFAMVTVEPLGVPPPPTPVDSDQLAALRNTIGYLSHDVAAALRKEQTETHARLITISNELSAALASNDALTAAIETLERAGA